MRVLFYLFMFIVLCLQALANNTIDPDFWARLLQGDYFLATGEIMKQDSFSYTPTHLWIDHEWGASVVFAFILKFFGFTGILVAKTFLIFLVFLLVFKTIRLNTEKNNSILNITLFFATVYALPGLTQSGFRCHFFTFFFFTLFLYILEVVRLKNKPLLLCFLPPIFLIWTNMHGGCVSGLGLLALYTLGEFLNKKTFKWYGITLIVSFLAMFINPYGIDYVKFIFMAATMPRPYITEWISPFKHSLWSFMLWFKILFFFYIAIIIKNIKLLKQDYTKLLVLIVCLILAAKNIKSTPFFIIVSFVFLYDYILISKIQNKIAVFMLALLFITISALSVNNIFFLREQPVKMTEFLRINELKGKILAPMDMGSYLAYKLYPNNLIYMDGRYEEVYFENTKNLMDNFFNIKNNWNEILQDRPDFLIIPINASVNDLLANEMDYKIIYNDGQNFLYSLKENLKQLYRLPSNDEYYYLKTAFTRL